MITGLLIRCMFAIAKMSKKASAIYLGVLTVFFGLALSAILYASLYLTNGRDDNPSHLIPVLAVGFVLFLIVLVMIALTTIASNYVRKNPDKNPVKK